MQGLDLPTAGTFWKSREAVWWELSQVGQWWAEYPTSSICAERGFGMMRVMESAQRMSMKEPNFKAELAFRINKPIVERMLNASLDAW